MAYLGQPLVSFGVMALCGHTQVGDVGTESDSVTGNGEIVYRGLMSC